MSFAKQYLQSVIRRFKYYKDLGDKTFEQLNDWDFQYQPNEESNSISIIIRHMVGNMMSRWTNFLSEDGEKKWRDRDNEFEAQDMTKQQLVEYWQKGWDCLFETLEGLKKKDLKKTIQIRGESLDVVDAINRQLAHYPYHIGQIIHIAKTIKGKKFLNLSIPKAGSKEYNSSPGTKDPSKNF
jgi:hypothetical protein